MMLAASVNRLENGHDAETADCAIISLGCYLGIPYTECLRAATMTDKGAGRDGLTVQTIKKMAAIYGATLTQRRRFDPDDDYGILVTPDHCAVLRNGLVFDRLTVWEWADWLVDQKIHAGQCSLLVVDE